MYEDFSKGEIAEGGEILAQHPYTRETAKQLIAMLGSKKRALALIDEALQMRAYAIQHAPVSHAAVGMRGSETLVALKGLVEAV